MIFRLLKYALMITQIQISPMSLLLQLFILFNQQLKKVPGLREVVHYVMTAGYVINFSMYMLKGIMIITSWLTLIRDREIILKN